LPDIFNWKVYKAQLYQESLLKADARSHVGAAGIAQFMPGTWKQMVRELRFNSKASPFTADLSIKAGAYYMAKLRRGWVEDRPEVHRHSLALASYNAGMGNIIKAQRVCGGERLYHKIIVCLPEVTGRHSKETIGYVNRIWAYWRRMMVE
jgi:membrane-bound lytic murein transglycosylase F